MSTDLLESTTITYDFLHHFPCEWGGVTIVSQGSTECDQEAMWVAICNACHRHDNYCDEHLSVMDMFSRDSELAWRCGSCGAHTVPEQSWRELYDILPLPEQMKKNQGGH